MRKIPLSTNGRYPITYHNASEIVSGRHGLSFFRVPRSWRDRFPEQTALRATQAAGVELRFRAATRTIALELRIENTIQYSAILALYHGRRNVSMISLPDRFEGKVILLDSQDEIDGVLDAPWRIICPYGAFTTVKALHLSDEAELLPVEHRPVRWLAHGDSITQGARALHPGMTYVNLVADELGWDALNLGFGGSAWGDAEVAEYIASRQDWDILSIAIGTNTYGGSKESAADYRLRYERFLSIIRQAHPDKPILCITPIWRRQDGPPEVGNDFGDALRAYREVITQVVQERRARDARLALLDGLQLIGNERGLSIDLVHPDAQGMMLMARGIADSLRSVLTIRA